MGTKFDIAQLATALRMRYESLGDQNRQGFMSARSMDANRVPRIYRVTVREGEELLHTSTFHSHPDDVAKVFEALHEAYGCCVQIDIQES